MTIHFGRDNNSDPISDDYDYPSAPARKPEPKQEQQQQQQTSLVIDLPRRPSQVNITYVFPEQRDMLHSFDRDQWGGLVQELLIKDQRVGPQPWNSRLQMHIGTDTVSEKSLVLLAQRTVGEIRAVLNNTLPQRMMGNPRDKIRQPSIAYKDDPDPVIYINYVVDSHGMGIPIRDYEKFLSHLELVADVIQAFEEPELQYFITNDKARKKGLAKAHTDLISQINAAFQKRRNLANPAIFLADTKPKKLEGSIRSWVKDHREKVLPDARQQTPKVTHIMIPGEVGVAKNGFCRTADHANLRSSPDLFRLVQLVLQAVFPASRFRLQSLYIFELGEAWQAEIGESLASLLCSSYVKAGGLNVAQAGISKEGIVTLRDDQWKVVSNRGIGTFQSWRHVSTNLERWTEVLNERFRGMDDRKEKVKRYQERVTQEQRCKDLDAQVAESNHAREKRCNDLEQLLKDVEYHNNRQSRAELDAKKLDEALKELRVALGAEPEEDPDDVDDACPSSTQ